MGDVFSKRSGSTDGFAFLHHLFSPFQDREGWASANECNRDVSPIYGQWCAKSSTTAASQIGIDNSQKIPLCHRFRARARMSAPNNIYHEEDRKNRHNRQSPDKRLSCFGMQSPLLRYCPTTRSQTYVDDSTDEIEAEQDYAPSLCPKVPTIQWF